MKKLLIALFIITLTISVIFIGPACNGINISSKVSVKDKIAFVSDRDGNSEIYIMNVDGSEQTRLTESPEPDYHPCFSPDGSKVAFVSDRDGKPEIYIMNSDGSEQRRLTYYDEESYYGIPVRSPCFSPDGSKVAFESYRECGGICIMNIDGRYQISLTGLTTIDSYYCLSPDWSKIALRRGGEAGEEGIGILVFEVYSYRVDEESITKYPAKGSSPRFSPDSSKITFVSNRDGNPEIYIMNTDGSEQRRLTDNSSDDMFPCFSPDGSKITFVSNRDGNWEIYIMNLDGSNQINLTNNQATDLDPSFSP